MNYKILDNYNRRGKRIWLTLELSDFGTLCTDDGEDYTKSYAWTGFELVNGHFTYIDDNITIHDTYPVPEELDRERVLELFNSSSVARKVLKQLKSK